MVCKDTLRIKHLPKELTDAQKEDFVRHFGAYKVKVISSKAKAKSIVYAKFENEDIAKNVMIRLHQINVLNCRLCVEYAETDILQGQLSTQKVDDLRDGPDKKFFKNFINNINAFNDSVGFYQPPPSHLKYSYPKANRPTINNIAHALATVPRFYTQVLHLMNKMNLPPPFAMPEPPVRTIPAAQAIQPPINIPSSDTTAEKRKISSSESEIESDGETNRSKEIIPQKRTIGKKRVVKRPKFIKQPLPQASAPSKPVEKAENVFDKVDVLIPRKIELKVTKDPVVKQPVEKPILPKKGTEISTASKTSKSVIEEKPPEKAMEVKKLPQKKSENILPLPKAKIVEEKVTSTDESRTKPVIVDTKVSKPILDTPKELEPITILEPQQLIPLVEVKSISKEEAPRKLENERDEIQKKDEKEETKVHQETKEPPEQTEPQVQQLKPDNLKEEPHETPSELPSSEDDFPCISLEELAANQITDLSASTVFKNYNAGEPTNKLYIKNCAKTVVIQDLEYIYNRYREEGTEQKPSEFNIRLMKEGRMKGQAFVTLDSVEQAQKAVKETNGFILKDKPLVVVFGKAGKKK